MLAEYAIAEICQRKKVFQFAADVLSSIEPDMNPQRINLHALSDNQLRSLGKMRSLVRPRLTYGPAYRRTSMRLPPLRFTISDTES